ncbi:hypothetical protein K0M31_010546 [Melipona bicolor]|uniref:Uncharacterized protein n=1 Tax=Melipona bicolor TaxID=60889 RepID=A0AA40FL99_9HYME|nr:hypothetical protein K0M31_010546 [Melipona bicolor]
MEKSLKIKRRPNPRHPSRSVLPFLVQSPCSLGNNLLGSRAQMRFVICARKTYMEAKGLPGRSPVIDGFIRSLSLPPGGQILIRFLTDEPASYRWQSNERAKERDFSATVGGGSSTEKTRPEEGSRPRRGERSRGWFWFTVWRCLTNAPQFWLLLVGCWSPAARRPNRKEAG